MPPDTVWPTLAFWMGDISPWIGHMGTAASIIGALVSIRQASAAKSARKAMESNAYRIRMGECARLLGIALNNTRPLLLTGLAARGRNNDAHLQTIRRDVDEAALVVSVDSHDELEDALSELSAALEKAQAQAASSTFSAKNLFEVLRKAARVARRLADDSASP